MNTKTGTAYYGLKTAFQDLNQLENIIIVKRRITEIQKPERG